jgi:imidazolonepropionase
MHADLLIKGASQIVVVPGTEPRVGDAMTEIGLIANASIATGKQRILAVGPEDEVRAKAVVDAETQVVDARGMVVTPGLVDCHNHVVWGGSREVEFEMRCAGKSYMEIAREGGGIRSTVRATRACSRRALVRAGLTRLRTMLECGTTTAEAKSGYGLDVATEAKCLEAIRVLNRRQPIELVPTFLGAHEFPDEYRNDREGYVALVVDQMLPRVAERGLAEFCDVFCEDGVFTVAQAREVLEAGKRHGLKPKIHADELTPFGGAELAAEIGAVSADHLTCPSVEGLERMASAGVIAVLLPGTTFFLGKKRYAPARLMIRLGVPVALATDLNPGSCFTESLPMVMTLACLQMKMTVAEALTASTLNAACALGLGHKIGSVEEGKQADMVVWDIPDYRHIAYHFGACLPKTVIKAGRVVH